MPRNRRLFVFLLTGLLSGVVCWSGRFVLPPWPVLAESYVGLVFGLALLILGGAIGVCRAGVRPLSSLVLVASSVAGWRLAVEVAAQGVSEDLPFAVAGAAGATCLTVGLLQSWRIARPNPLFVIPVILGGALGGLGFRLIAGLLGDFLSQAGWDLLLYAFWQTVFMLGLWVGTVLCEAEEAPPKSVG